MPILVVVFTVGAYGFGTALRGNDVIVNEVAIVRGAAGATDGTGQIYLGVFSPSRGQYQLQVPGGALLSSPINGDVFGGTGAASQLDVLQGDPARVRNLDVGFGSLRTIRAETAVTVPLVQTDLRLEDGRLRGTVKNASTEPLQDAGRRPGRHRGPARGPRARRRGHGRHVDPEQPVRPVAVGQGGRPDLLPGRHHRPTRTSCTLATRWSTS